MKASDVTIDWLLSRLEGVEGDNGSYMAWCPCHDDVGSTHKGLSITVSGKRILCKCHSPHCRATLTKVIAALEDTSPNGHEPELKVSVTPKTSTAGMAWWVQKTGVARSIWEALGVEEFEGGIAFTFTGETYLKYRKPPKDFGWTQKLGPETPPLWPYPADELPSEISIWEGESDAGTAHAAGLPFAFAVTKGSDTELTEEHFRALADRGVTSVLVGSDTDTPGKAFREEVERAAVDADLDVRVLELERVIDPFSGGKDLNWVWRTAEDQKQFHSLIARATRDAREVDPRMTPEVIGDLVLDEEFFYLPGLLSPGDKAILGGPPKSYKTWVLLDLCRSLSTCTPFMGRDVWTPTSPVNILLIQEEGSLRSWARRLFRLQILDTSFNKHFYTWHRQGFRFTDEAAVSSLIAYMKRREIEVVAFDPLQRMIPGVNENDNTEMAVIWDQVMRMQKAIPTLACVICHHMRKDTEKFALESLRGASRHAGEIDLGIFVEKHPLEQKRFRCRIDGRDVATEMAPGEVFEGSIAIEEDSFKIDAAEFKVTTKSVKKDHTGESLKEVLKIIEAGAHTRTDIKAQLGWADNTVVKYLNMLIEQGILVEEKFGNGRPNVYTIK